MKKNPFFRQKMDSDSDISAYLDSIFDDFCYIEIFSSEVVFLRNWLLQHKRRPRIISDGADEDEREAARILFILSKLRWNFEKKTLEYPGMLLDTFGNFETEMKTLEVFSWINPYIFCQ